MEQVEQCFALLQLQALNSASTFPALKVLIRISHRNTSDESSGHKYGLVYAGLGWVIFRNEEQLPKYLKFELHYLGGTLPR